MHIGLRIIGILAIVRETMSSFISDGHFIGYPGRIIRPARENTDPVYLKRRRDEFALDCRIRAAVQTDDLIEEWARNLGRQVQTDVRREGALLQEAVSGLQNRYTDPGTELQDEDAGPFRTACGRFGIPVATAARSLLKFMRDREQNIREGRNANPHHGSEADSMGPIRARDAVKARPQPPPPPRRPNVSDARAGDE
eukprot:5085984-Pyramimonas_sp.AAC.1